MWIEYSLYKPCRSFRKTDPVNGGCSSDSNVCSSSSGGTGDSACSLSGGSSEELDW